MQTVVVRPPSRSTLRSALLLFVGTSLAVACSGGDDAADAGATTGSDPSVATAPVGVSEPASAAPAISSDSDSVTSSTAATVVADTGVAGLDSDDAFCRSWSEFAGSFQAVALSASMATTPLDGARAEVAAASTIVAAVAGLGDALPAALEPERDALIDGYVGPLARRASDAVDSLRAAGLDDADVSAIGAVWLATLAGAGLDEPIVDIPVDQAVADRFDQAVAAFAAARPSIVEDPTLITDASTPLTFEYLAAHCPDQGTLGGNDIVDQP